MQTQIWIKKYMLRPVARCNSGCPRWSQRAECIEPPKMELIIYLSFATASISFTVTETRVFLLLRESLKKKSAFFGELVSCGYCFGHWVAFVLVAVYRPRLFAVWWLLDYFLTALAIAWLSAFQWILLCWLMAKTGK